MARDDRIGRRIDDVDVDACAVRRRRDPNDPTCLGPSAVKDLVIRDDDRERSYDLARWSLAGGAPTRPLAFDPYLLEP
jgi:hypothetical protein